EGVFVRDGHGLVAGLVAAIHALTLGFCAGPRAVFRDEVVAHTQASKGQDGALGVGAFLSALANNFGGHKDAMLGQDRIDRVVNVINAAILEALRLVLLVLTD